MDSSGAVYAKVPTGGVAALEAAIETVRGRGFHAGPLGVLAFDPALHEYGIVDRWGRSDDMPAWSEGPDLNDARELRALSRLVGDVVAFYEVDEGLTTGVYGAWREGELVRALEWADDEWCRVEGEPQPWEAPLFAPERLAHALENAADDGQDEAAPRAAFAAGRIERGARWPAPDRMAVHIRTAHPGPAHGFLPWPRRSDVVKLSQAKASGRFPE